MATCVQVVNPTVLGKIESFFSDPAYREVIENSANYNTRLCIERRLRMPFLDSQTGVAQNHSNLFMTPRQRIPGLYEGQIYTYPSKRWKKKRRQYLMNFMQPRRKEIDPEGDMHTISTVENPAACNEDSKDSVGLKDETTKSSTSITPLQFSVMQDAWYYDEIDMQEMEGFDDPDPDSDYDYEESYTKRKKKTKKVTRNSDSPAAKKPKGPGRGRKKTNYDGLTDAEKPFACERGVTRRGGRQSAAAAAAAAAGAMGGSGLPQSSSSGQNPSGSSSQGTLDDSAPLSAAVAHSQDKKGSGEMGPIPEDKERAVPSPYCDFCLGDAHENKKTGHPEELVSCSDCGRSGRHPPPVPTPPPPPATGGGPGRRGRGRGRGRRKAVQ